MTEDVRDMFKTLTSECIIDVYKKVKEVLIALDARGYMTIFGMRTSSGSQNEVWPTKGSILDGLNK